VSDAALLAKPVARTYGARGLAGWLTTTDHKRIGLLYIFTALVFLLVAVSFAMLMRTQLIRPDNTFLTPNQYDQIFTMHGTTMIFLFGMPILIGVANYMIPLQIGARDMAFPRMNALSYWVFLFGGLLLYSSFFFGGALNTGWYSYAPLTEKQFSPHDAVTFWILALVLLGISSMLGAVNFIMTMLKMRAPGLSFWQMPMLAIATFLNSFLIIVAIPSLTAAVGMLYLDRRYGTVFYQAAQGGDPLVWQHLFWFFGHPEVYILILPVFGMVSDVLPPFTRKPLFGRTTMIIMIMVIGLLSFMVWGHHMFAAGMPTYFNAVMAATSMLIAIPTGVKIFNWLGTMWRGSLRFNTPLLFICGLIALFTVGGISGVTQAVVPFDWQVTATYYIVAHLHNVLIPGTVFGVFAGLYYWFPKMTGRMLSDRLGKVHFWTMLFGFMGTFLPMYALGLMGMPRRVYTYPSGFGWDTLNLISSLSAYLLGFSIALFAINVVRSLVAGERAGDNPWEAWTLEWATTSPPPPGNFVALPPIRSERPLWDLQHQPDAAPSRSPAPQAVALHPWVEQYSIAPILAALAMLAVAVGLLGFPVLVVAAALGLIVVMAVWAATRWPEGEIAYVRGERFSAGGQGMLTFLLSEVVLFGTLVWGTLHLRSMAMVWPPAGMPHLGVAFPAVNTDVLIASGIVAHLALVNYRKGRTATFRTSILVTIALGAAFLVGQAWEYAHVGFSLSSGLLGSTFFALTGLHGLHVTGGLLLLGYMLFRSFRDERDGVAMGGRGSEGLMAAGTYYWHFVDVVWVVIFVVVYLL
jgi:cytochrome c oxidase subunit I